MTSPTRLHILDDSKYCVAEIDGKPCGNTVSHPVHQGQAEPAHLFQPPDQPTEPDLDALFQGENAPPDPAKITELPGKSWQPVDLGPYLRGEKTRIEPTIGITRSDGQRFLYAAKEHAVIGAMESGKSWFSLGNCAAELTSGNHVVYLHFEECDPTDTVERLQALGVPNDAIAERFHFIGPEEPVRPEWVGLLLEYEPTLVILDGVNEAMALHGMGIREEDGAADFRRRLVKPWTAAGAAVLSADHVVKDKERRDLGPLGSVHKGNGLSGSLILLDNAEPFGRGQRGRSHVYVTKDRPGHLRRTGRATKTPGKTFVGELVVDDTREHFDYLDMTFWAPASTGQEDPAPDAKSTDDDHVLDVVRTLTADGVKVTGRAVRSKCGLGTNKALDALERLVIDKRLMKTPGKSGSFIYSLPADDPAERSCGPVSKETGTAVPPTEPGPDRSQDHTGPHRTTQKDSPLPKSGIPGVFGPGEWAAAGHPGLNLPGTP